MSDEDGSMNSSVARTLPQGQMVSTANRFRSHVRFMPTSCRANWIELHDASRRQSVRRIDINFPCELMAVNVPLPTATIPLVWSGDQHLLLGNPKLSQTTLKKGLVGLDRSLMLVDLPRRAVVWSYLINQQDNVSVASKTSDGRLWWTGPTGATGARQLVAASLPEPVAMKQLEGKAFDSQALVRPGSSVQLQFDVSAPPGIQDFSQKARTLIDNAAKDNGLTIKAGEPIRLIVSIASAPDTGTFTLESFGLGVGNTQRTKTTVNRKSVAVRVAFEINGKAAWESKQTVSNSFFGITRLPEGKDIQTALDERMWEQSLATLRQNLPPSYVFKAESALGLGSSRLTGNGPTPNAK